MDSLGAGHYCYLPTTENNTVQRIETIVMKPMLLVLVLLFH